MSLQARYDQHDPRLYNANRDVAHCFGSTMDEVLERALNLKWPALRDYLKEKGVTDAELGRAVCALSTFVATNDVPKESMSAALTRSGWYDVSDPAMVGVTSILGTVMMGYFYTGTKEATLGGNGPCLTYRDLQRAGHECAQLMAIPRWQRPWYRFKARLERIWRALRSD